MKKSIVFFAALLMCIEGVAKPVSQQKAENVAMKFLGIEPMTKGADPLHLIWTGEPITRVGVGDPALYVFGLDGGGFIIVAGDDRLRPVLGYSDKSVFNVKNMPDHIAGWFKSITETVKQVRRAGGTQSNEVSKEWNSVPKRSSQEVKLQTALWSQEYPYNMYTPMLFSNGTEHCTTGCTNTATAIVMRFHKHPEAGVGVLPDYTYSKGITRTQSGHTLGYKYDWDNMPTYNLDESTPMYQAKQVAQLMFDCGVMNKCKWNEYVAEADPFNIPRALATYMGYDKSIRSVERKDFNTDEWENVIRGEIDCRRPVIYAGQHDEGNGHVWVIDGYASSGYFYMNWGWGGTMNGFFVISPLSDAANNYTINHRMVIGIQPDEGGEPYGGEPYLTGSSTSNWRFDLNRSFTTVFNIRNPEIIDNSINCRVALIDNSGNLKWFLSEPETKEIEGYMNTVIESTCIMKSMPNIDDRIILFYEENGIWRPMEYTDETTIKMKGPSAIEDCTYVTYSKETHILTVNTEKDNAIQIYYTDSDGHYFIRMSQQNSGTNSINTATVPTTVGNGYSPYDFTVHVFNLAESKEIRLKLK